MMMMIFSPGLVSDKTNIVFEPVRSDVDELVRLATERLETMACNDTEVRSQNPNDETDTYLLRNSTVNTVIVDFSATNDLQKGQNLAYNIIVRTPNIILKSDQIDTSFISYQHPGILSDRTNSTNRNRNEGSELPEFTDVKIFVDSLLMT